MEDLIESMCDVCATPFFRDIVWLKFETIIFWNVRTIERRFQIEIYLKIKSVNSNKFESKATKPPF